MAFNKGDKSDSSRVRRGGMHRRKKVCVFCGDKNGEIDYKDVNKLKRYVSERGKSSREESQATAQSTREL